MCKIVIIEDDIDICNMIKKFLENNKYSVQYALNGIEIKYKSNIGKMASTFSIYED